MRSSACPRVRSAEHLVPSELLESGLHDEGRAHYRLNIKLSVSVAGIEGQLMLIERSAQMLHGSEGTVAEFSSPAQIVRPFREVAELRSET